MTDPCDWCGEPSVGFIWIVPDKFGTVKGKRVLKKRGVKAFVCAAHRQSLKPGDDIRNKLNEDWANLTPEQRYRPYERGD